MAGNLIVCSTKDTANVICEYGNTWKVLYSEEIRSDTLDGIMRGW